MTAEYYCDIPWQQVWEEFERWWKRFVGGADWDEQEAKLQAILERTIPWPLPWPQIWDDFAVWHERSRCPTWPRQQRYIQRLVQRAANEAVN